METFIIENKENLVYVFLFIGIIIRSIYSTVKGVKKVNNGTPTKFDLIYWIKDNVSQKIISITPMIYLIGNYIKLPNNSAIIETIVYLVIALICGILSDYISEIAVRISKKNKQ